MVLNSSEEDEYIYQSDSVFDKYIWEKIKDHIEKYNYNHMSLGKGEVRPFAQYLNTRVMSYGISP